MATANDCKASFVTELAYIFAFVSGKLAFVFYYVAIFPSKIARHINICLGALLLLQLVEETTVVLLQCRPLRKSWDLEAPGSCLNLVLFFYISFGIKLATDLVLFCLPIPMLRSLKINRAKKIGVIFMFSLGLL
jgi:hypothetical protein